MEKVIELVKLAIALVGSFILNALGGKDDLLLLIAVLACADIVFGGFKGVKKKEFSSAILFWGLVNKAFMFCVVAIMQSVDNVLGVNIFRNAFLIWFGICDGASIIENSAAMGLPWPDGLLKILIQVRKGFSINISKIVKKMIDEYIPEEKEG